MQGTKALSLQHIRYEILNTLLLFDPVQHLQGTFLLASQECCYRKGIISDEFITAPRFNIHLVY